MKKPFFKFFIFLCVVLVISVQCQTSGPGAKKSKYASEVNSEMRNQFAVAEEHYRKQNYAQAEASYKAYIEAYPYNHLTDESYYKMAKIYFLKKDFAKAIENFSSILRHSPDQAYIGKAGHYAGYAAFLSADYEKSYQFLKEVKPTSLPVKLRLQFFSLAISLAEKDQKYADFSDYALLRLYDTYEEVASQLRDFEGQQVLPYQITQSRVNVWVNTPIAIDQITNWMKNYPLSPAKELVDYKISKAYFTGRRESKSTAQFLNSFLKNYPRSTYAPEIKSMLADMGSPVMPVKEKEFVVGLILQDEQAKAYSDDILQGVHCAVGLAGVCGETSSAEIIQKTSGSDVATLRVAFEELKAQKVSSVIVFAPSLAEESASLAAELNMPTFIISQQEGLMKQSDVVYQVGLLPEKQIEDLVETAIKEGHKRFAIYYPQINYGKLMSSLFEKEVQSRGGKVIAKVSYDKASPDPYASAEALQKALETMGGVKTLDALFVPDSFVRMSHLITGLQFYKLTGFTMLGTNTWNDPKLTPTLATLYPQSLFVDIYSSADTSELVQDFKNRFSQSFSHEPSLLNALGYDTMMMIRSAVNQEGAGRLAQTLKERFGYRGVTGVRGFQAGVAPIVQTTVIRVQTLHGR